MISRIHVVIDRLRRHISNRPFLQSVFRLGAGTALGQAAVVLTTPVLTRFYSPADMGLVGLFVAFLMPAIVAVALRYDMAIPLGAGTQEQDNLLLISAFLVLPTALVETGAYAALVKWNVFDFGRLPLWTGIPMFVTLVAAGLFSALRFWYVGRGDFRGIGRALVSQGLTRALVPILLAPTGIGWSGLLIGEIAARVAGIRGLYRRASHTLAGALTAATRSGLLNALTRHVKYPTVFLPSQLLDTLGGSVPLAVVSARFGVVAAGIFFLANRIVVAPGSLVSASVADVYHHRFVSDARKTAVAARALLLAAIPKLAMVGMGIYVPLVVLAPLVAVPVLGTKWANDTGIIIALLCPASLVNLVVSPLSRALQVSRIPQIKLLVDIVRLGLPSGTLYYAGSIGISLVHGIALFSGACVLGDLVHLAAVWYAVGPSQQHPRSGNN